MAKKEKFLSLMGLNLPIVIEDHVLKVEHHHVPELGFGWNGRYGGTPSYRKFIQDRFGTDIKPSGEKTYIFPVQVWPIVQVG